MNLRQIGKKARAIVVKGPATARNMVFSWFDFWPTRRLRNDAVRKLPVYCVSLPNEVRRRRILSRQVEQLGFDHFEYIDGVIGSELDPAELDRQGIYDDRRSMELRQRSLTRSEIACSLSHGRAYDRIVERGHDIALVIEDDVLFMPSRLDRIELDKLPAGWDIAFLNSFVDQGRPRRLVAGRLYEGDAYTGSSAAYLVSAQGVRKLAADYKPVVMAADGYTGRNDLARYMYYPDCALNGSVCHYYNSAIQFLRPIAKK